MDDLTAFLKNTEKALRTNTVQELNSAIVLFLKNKDDRREEINNVLETVAEHYGISKRTLIKSSARGNIQTARVMSYCLLNFELGLTTRYIANTIFNKWQNAISNGIKYYKRLDSKIKTDKEFIDSYVALKKKITNPNESIQ